MSLSAQTSPRLVALVTPLHKMERGVARSADGVRLRGPVFMPKNSLFASSLPGASMIRMLVLFALALQSLLCSAQITDSISNTQFGLLTISSFKKTVDGKQYLVFQVSHQGRVVLTDSVITSAKTCTGFSVPAKQPFAGYFIFCKREKNHSKTYILNKTGQVQVIAGGSFWAAPKDKLLFILAERDNTNLLIYDLKQMKAVLEKFNCDEFSGWYYHRGKYMGRVLTECGEENESEVHGFIHQLEAEQFDPKTMALNEIHVNEEDLEHAKALQKYAACK